MTRQYRIVVQFDDRTKRSYTVNADSEADAILVVRQKARRDGMHHTPVSTMAVPITKERNR